LRSGFLLDFVLDFGFRCCCLAFAMSRMNCSKRGHASGCSSGPFVRSDFAVMPFRPPPIPAAGVNLGDKGALFRIARFVPFVKKGRWYFGVECKGCHQIIFLFNDHPVCTEKSDSAILVMKTAEDKLRCDDAEALNGARERGIFAQRAMNSRLVVISGQ